MSKLTRFYHAMGVSPQFDPSNRFETSWLLPPFLLAAWRTLVSLFIFFSLFFVLSWRNTHRDAVDSRRSFSFITNLSFWGMSFYSLFAAIHTFSYARKGRALLNGWPKPLQALHSLYYSTIVVFPFMVTMIYWTWLYDGHWYIHKFDAYYNVSAHAVNSVIALSEILLPRTSPIPLLHIPFLVAILGLYFGVAYISRPSEDFYVYPFLNPHRQGSGTVAAYCLGIVGAMVIIFLIVWALIWCRRWVTEVKWGMAKLYPSAKQENYEDVEMVNGGREKSVDGSQTENAPSI